MNTFTKSDESRVPLKQILILGASGMLGHMLVRILSPHHNVVGTTSSKYNEKSPLARMLSEKNWVDQVDVRNLSNVEKTIRDTKADVVINCVGVIKQKMESSNIMDAILINSLIPHQLANICNQTQSRLIHFSTDCVFDGSPGIKKVDDVPNATDLYGTTKRLGEVNYAPALTLRTGFVGRQLSGYEGLFEWVISQRGKTIDGYQNAIYSGFTAMALSRIIRQIIEEHDQLSGLHQVAGNHINKFDLITKLNEYLDLDLTINRNTVFMCDRSMDGTEFTKLTDIAIPSWDDMLFEFAADQDFYNFN
jgi:dTDP-4-dehydrorhamnose reductase